MYHCDMYGTHIKVGDYVFMTPITGRCNRTEIHGHMEIARVAKEYPSGVKVEGCPTIYPIEGKIFKPDMLIALKTLLDEDQIKSVIGRYNTLAHTNL